MTKTHNALMTKAARIRRLARALYPELLGGGTVEGGRKAGLQRTPAQTAARQANAAKATEANRANGWSNTVKARAAKALRNSERRHWLPEEE